MFCQLSCTYLDIRNWNEIIFFLYKYANMCYLDRFVFSDKKYYSIGKNRCLTFSFFLQKELIGNFFRVWSRRRGGTTVLKISGFGTLVQGCLVSKAWAEWLNVLPAWKHWMDTALDAAAATRCIGFKSLKPAKNNLDYMWFDDFFTRVASFPFPVIACDSHSKFVKLMQCD